MRILVISDIHSNRQALEAVLRAERDIDLLVFAGDFVDYGIDPVYVVDFFRSYDKPCVLVRGNHDDFLDNLAPLQLGNIRIVKDYILESNGKRYYVTHGDIFDRVTTQMKWLAQLGDTGYTFLLWFNSIYNRYRTYRGKPYYSLSQRIKQKVKTAVSYISDFESTLSDFALARRFDGIICGHIHHPANTYYGNIHYLNSGDWVETMSALTEDESGNWHILMYTDTPMEYEILKDTTIPRLSSAI